MTNREIKFRAYVLCHSGMQMLYMQHLEKLDDGIGFFTEEHIDDWEHGALMQYVGLSDKNGKPIYEGDIVEAKTHSPSLYVVEFKEGGFCMTNPQIEGYPIDINHFYPSVGTSLVVVGNIHENSELLKKLSNA